MMSVRGWYWCWCWWCCWWCCTGFVLLSSPAAAAGSARQLELGIGHVYRLTSTLLLSEPSLGPAKDVGYQITADVTLGTVWASNLDTNNKLIQVEIANPQLHIKSRKAPAPEGFVAHSSELSSLKNGAFLVHWNSGQVVNIYVAKEEVISIVNFKKGISSLLQYQLLDMETNETDASGSCRVSYKSVDPTTISKIKDSCVSSKDTPYSQHPDKVLGSSVNSERKTRIVLSSDLSALHSVETDETHTMRVNVRQEAASQIQATQELTLTDVTVKVMPIKAENVQAAVRDVEKNSGQIFVQQTLALDRESNICSEATCPTLGKLVKENREALDEKYLGTIRSAAAFVRLMPLAREASQEDISKLLKNSRNKDILLALCDLAGGAQTVAAHQAAMKAIQLDGAEVDLDAAERYFWALSSGSQPKKEVLADVLRLSEKKYKEAKLSETLLLTLGAMAHRYMKLPIHDSKLGQEVRISLETGLSKCEKDDESCRLRYLRALRNLACPVSIPTLLENALHGTRRTSVAAMKALVMLPVESWSSEVIQACERIFLQLGRRYDSSARTLALDIILTADPSQAMLRELLLYLRRQDPAYEVKQYLLQRVRQFSDRNAEFAQKVKNIMKSEGRVLNNYDALAQRGLSTAFSRSFLSGPSANGSLVSIQEISGGLLKRGIVDVSVESAGASSSIFTLGLFAGGLSSFISSDADATGGASGEADEEATAGMEVTLLGAQVRPFVFFNGHGELMGHVWSGTASTRTPAFQALSLLQDHREFLPLQTGFVADITLLGGMSFELAGEVQLSLWNRNAHSLVEKNAGLSLTGLTRVDSAFVRSQVEFNVATEAHLNLVSNLDFSGGMALCMQLKQPDSVLKHNVYKVERIPGSKHRLRKSKYQVYRIPGRTYALNHKNNEMCNLIFKDQ